MVLSLEFHKSFIFCFFVLLCFHVLLEGFSSKCCKTKSISRALWELKKKIHAYTLRSSQFFTLFISLPSRLCGTSRSTASERRILRHVINFIELTVTVTVLGVFVNKLKFLSFCWMRSSLLKGKLGSSHLITLIRISQPVTVNDN